MPVVCYVGSLILTTVLAYTSQAGWIAWTPIPYLQLSNFFMPTAVTNVYYDYYNLNPVQIMTQNGRAAQPDLWYNRAGGTVGHLRSRVHTVVPETGYHPLMRKSHER